MDVCNVIDMQQVGKYGLGVGGYMTNMNYA